MLRPFMASLRALWLPVLAAVALTAACGDDAGSGGDDDDDMGVDAGPVDAGPLMSDIFGPCNGARDCLGESAICRGGDLGWPQGSCSRRCTSSADCSSGGTEYICVDDDDPAMDTAGVPRGLGSTCHRICGSSSACLDGEVCVTAPDVVETQTSPSRAGMTCIPWACPQEGGCASGAVCGPGGICIDPDDMPAGDGEIGDICNTGDSCATGICDSNQLVFRPEGMFLVPIFSPTCAANCILPRGYNSINFYDPEGSGPGLPSGTCGEGNVCVPRFLFGFYPTQGGAYADFVRFSGGQSQLGQRDPGRCFRGCSADTDCRDDQICVTTFQDLSGNDYSYGTGVCYPDPNAD